MGGQLTLITSVRAPVKVTEGALMSRKVPPKGGRV